MIKEGTTTGPVAGSISAADLISCAARQVEDAAATLWPGEPFLVHCQVPTITGHVQRVQVGQRHLYAKLSILGVSLVSLLRGLYGPLEHVAREQRLYAARPDNLPRREADQLAFLAELGRPRVCELAGVHGAVLFTASADGPSMADVLAAAPERTADLLGEVMQELDGLRRMDRRRLPGVIEQRGIAATFARKFGGPDGDAYVRSIGEHRCPPEQRRAVVALLRASIGVLLRRRPPASPAVLVYGDLKPEHVLYPDSGQLLLLDPGLRTAWHGEDFARLVSRTLLQAVTEMDLAALGRVYSGVAVLVDQHARPMPQAQRWIRNLTALWLMDTINIMSSYLTAPPDLQLARRGAAVARQPLLVATVVHRAATALDRHHAVSVWESALARTLQAVMAA
ncbi:Phosphotransferase enzyme family protein [Sinosporangium album]|uniref:Phosphotransferase enzyme family protein n=1 Tax=Sinosporangium album TaxID=504805 RepID=A0A1G8KVV1_9ACTN|nr:phosphotransferase [Sinosporangium album]SDI47030.1 Phosphotransferase enzyme family protein [Sinosporangium album]